MSHLIRQRGARHSLLLGCALAALATPAIAAPGATPGAAPTVAPGTAAATDTPGAAPAGNAGNADSPLHFEVPAGWQPLPEQSERISIELNTDLVTEPPVPGLSFTAQASTWRGPDAALVVTWLHATTPAEFPTMAARALLDRMRATPANAALDPGDTRLGSWNESVARGMAEAELTWQHLANQTTTLSRALVFATADGRPGMVRADCVIAAVTDETALAAPRAACEQALESLSVKVPAERLASLDALPPASPEATAVAPAAGVPAGASGPGAGSVAPAPSLRAPGPGSDTVMVLPPRDSETRSPPWLFLIGALVLAAGLYYTLRSRRAAGRTDDQDEDDAPGDDAPGDGAPGDDPDDDDPQARQGEPDDDPDDEPDSNSDRKRGGHPGDRGNGEGLS
jgi:hypothetical protein